MDEGKARKARRRLSERGWREVLAKFDVAAMTVQEFCSCEGLTRSSFSRWRSRLRGDTRPGGAGTVAVASATVPAPKPAFFDLGSLARADAVDQGGALDLRIELGGGISVHLVRR